MRLAIYLWFRRNWHWHYRLRLKDFLKRFNSGDPKPVHKSYSGSEADRDAYLNDLYDREAAQRREEEA